MATSDVFFERSENRVRAHGFGLAVIDGDHSFAQALRDFQNLEALAAANYDVIPKDAKPATPLPGQGSIPAISGAADVACATMAPAFAAAQGPGHRGDEKSAESEWPAGIRFAGRAGAGDPRHRLP